MQKVKLKPLKLSFTSSNPELQIFNIRQPRKSLDASLNPLKTKIQFLLFREKKNKPLKIQTDIEGKK